MIEKSKVLGYGYHYNYFGTKKYKDRNVASVAITIGFVIKDNNGNYVEFDDDEGILDKIIKVSFDSQKYFKVTPTKTESEINEIKNIKGWKSIETTVLGYEIGLGNGFVEGENISKKDLYEFMKGEENEFNISDNKNAQTLSFCVVEVNLSEIRKVMFGILLVE